MAEQPKEEEAVPFGFKEAARTFSGSEDSSAERAIGDLVAVLQGEPRVVRSTQ